MSQIIVYIRLLKSRDVQYLKLILILIFYIII